MSPLIVLHASRLRRLKRDQHTVTRDLLIAIAVHVKNGTPAKDVAKTLKISRQHLCDIQKGRRGISDGLLATLVKL